MLVAKPCSTPICNGNKLHLGESPLFAHPYLYRSTIGALQYLTNTCPDISFAASKLSQFLHSPTMHIGSPARGYCNIYIKGTIDFGLSYHPAKVITVEGFSDADWACNIDDGKSMSGV